MPAFITSPVQIRPALYPGKLGYSLGDQDTKLPVARLQVTSVAITSNVATLGVKVLEGNIPVVTAGQPAPVITVQGTQTTTSGGAPNFNVTNVALTAVSIDSGTGIGTLTFALVSTDIATTPDSGMAYVPVPETADTATSSTKGRQFALSGGSQTVFNDRVVSWSYEFPSAPSSATVNLQGANVDKEAAYTTLDTQATIVAAGETRTLSIPASVNFVRITLSALSGGTNPTIIGRIAC